MDQSTEKIINLRDLFFYVLKKWRWLCLFLIIGLAVGSLYSYKQVRDNQPEVIEARILAMNENDLDMARIKQYADYKALYQNQLDSEEDSILLKLDPQAVWTGEVRYFISATRDNIDSISAEYSSLLRQTDIIERMIQAYGSDITERQIRDLVVTGFTKNAVDSDISLEDTYKLRTGIAYATVTAPDENTCRALITQLRTILGNTNNDLVAEYGTDFSARDLNEYVQFGYSSNVQAALQSAVETRRGYLTQIANLEKEMAADEKLYYEYHYESEKEKTPAGFSKKWVIVLGLGMVVLCAGWFVVKYVFDCHIKTVEEFKMFYDISVLGIVGTGQKKNFFIDRWIYHWEQKGKMAINNVAYVSSVISSMSFDKAVISGSDEIVSIGSKSITEILSNEDNRLIATGDLGEDNKAQTVLRESDGAILIAKLYRSKNAGIRREIDVAEVAGKKILGVVVID